MRAFGELEPSCYVGICTISSSKIFNSPKAYTNEIPSNHESNPEQEQPPALRVSWMQQFTDILVHGIDSAKFTELQIILSDTMDLWIAKGCHGGEEAAPVFPQNSLFFPTQNTLEKASSRPSIPISGSVPPETTSHRWWDWNRCPLQLVHCVCVFVRSLRIARRDFGPRTQTKTGRTDSSSRG